MRGLLAFLVLAAAAVTVALLARINAGYALFVAPPYRVELSLNTFFLLTAIAFIALYAFVRIVTRLSRLPRDVRDHRRRRQVGRARAKEDAAVVALIEGRHGKARQFADESLAIPGSSPVGSLIAARAALETRDFDAVESALARPEARAPSLAVSRLMLEAEVALERGQPVDALARLAELKKEAGLHTAALRLELRALTAAGRHTEIAALIDQLVKRKVYDTAQGEVLRASAHAEALARFAHDASGLRDYWNRLPDAEKLQPARLSRWAATAKPPTSLRAVSIGVGTPILSRSTPNAQLPTRHGSWRPPSDGWSTTIRMQRCCTRLAACASARSCGARRKRISRRVSRSITAGAQISRLARCKRISAAPMKRMRIWPQR